MGCPDGIAAHILQQFELMPNSRAIHSSSERTKVVVIAHTAEFSHFAVQEKAFFGNVFQFTHAYSGLVAVALFAVLEKSSHHGVEIRCFG